MSRSAVLSCINAGWLGTALLPVFSYGIGYDRSYYVVPEGCLFAGAAVGIVFWCHNSHEDRPGRSMQSLARASSGCWVLVLASAVVLAVAGRPAGGLAACVTTTFIGFIAGPCVSVACLVVSETRATATPTAAVRKRHAYLMLVSRTTALFAVLLFGACMGLLHALGDHGALGVLGLTYAAGVVLMACPSWLLSHAIQTLTCSTGNEAFVTQMTQSEERKKAFRCPPLPMETLFGLAVPPFCIGYVSYAIVQLALYVSGSVTAWDGLVGRILVELALSSGACLALPMVVHTDPRTVQMWGSATVIVSSIFMNTTLVWTVVALMAVSLVSSTSLVIALQVGQGKTSSSSSESLNNSAPAVATACAAWMCGNLAALLSSVSLLEQGNVESAWSTTVLMGCLAWLVTLTNVPHLPVTPSWSTASGHDDASRPVTWRPPGASQPRPYGGGHGDRDHHHHREYDDVARPLPAKHPRPPRHPQGVHHQRSHAAAGADARHLWQGANKAPSRSKGSKMSFRKRTTSRLFGKKSSSTAQNTGATLR